MVHWISPAQTLYYSPSFHNCFCCELFHVVFKCHASGQLKCIQKTLVMYVLGWNLSDRFVVFSTEQLCWGLWVCYGLNLNVHVEDYCRPEPWLYFTDSEMTPYPRLLTLSLFLFFFFLSLSVLIRISFHMWAIFFSLLPQPIFSKFLV